MIRSDRQIENGISRPSIYLSCEPLNWSVNTNLENAKILISCVSLIQGLSTAKYCFIAEQIYLMLAFKTLGKHPVSKSKIKLNLFNFCIFVYYIFTTENFTTRGRARTQKCIRTTHSHVFSV